MKKLLLTLSLGLFVIPFGMSQDLPSYVPTDGLVAYYPFNGNANDESGNGNHGTVNGATLTSDRDGNGNSSYSFDGIDDYIVLFENGKINFDATDSFSYSLWFKQGASTENSYGNPNGTILASKNNARNGTYITVGYPNNTVTFFIEGDQDLNNSVASSSILNHWVYLSFVYDSSSRTLKAFNNGSKVDELVVTESLVGDLLYNSMWIGRRTNYTPLNTYVVGSIDDIGIWNRALTEQEMQNLYTSSDILLNGVVSAENNQIKNVADPTHTQDAATKGYVDSNVNSFSGSYNDLTDTPTSSNAFQLPLVTTDQRDEITPQSGMMVYNIDVHEFQGFQNYEKIHPAEIDQQHVTINNGGGENRAQSFTAGVTGQLELVKLPLNVMMEPVELLFKIIEGEGVDGNVLFETSYNLTNSDQNWIEFSISGVDVISGNKYTIQIIENSGCGMPPCYNWGMDTSGDNYIGGQFFYNGTPYSNGDYDSAFITYVSLREAVNEWRTLH